jgi:hypothetical protein
MAERLRMTFGEVTLDVVCRDTPTARAVRRACPLSGTTQTWGAEAYFTADIDAPLEADARAVVTAGEIAFWPDGGAIAVGYGPTPISRGEEIRLAAPTNIFADAEGDVSALAKVPAGAPVRVEVVDGD